MDSPTWTAWLCLIAAACCGCGKRNLAEPTPAASSSRLPAVANDAPSARAQPDGTAPATSASHAGALTPPPSGPRLLALGFSFSATHPEKNLTWHLVEKYNWQASSADLPPLPGQSPIDPKSCPEGMVLVEGSWLLDTKGREDTDEVQFLQNGACTHWLTNDRGVNALCDRFDRDKWIGISAGLPRKPLRFCIDRYEFPNAYGEFPLVAATFAESEAYCTKAGKRVCTENEWTFACEGEEGLPFPYGYARDGSVCNIGILGPAPDEDTFVPRMLERTARGIDLAWRGKRSGESPRCTSPFGVEDLTGNVDEWTRSVRPYGYQMILKGGHWGPGRQRCRPQTRGHGPHYVRYDQGVRCCTDDG